MNTCDCPVCMPRGEVKAKRYRERVYKRMDALGLRDSLRLTFPLPAREPLR